MQRHEITRRWRGTSVTVVATAIVFSPAWYQLPMSVIGGTLLWMPEIPRDTFLEEYFILLVFTVIGGGQSYEKTQALIDKANRAIPGVIIVTVCWFVMVETCEEINPLIL